MYEVGQKVYTYDERSREVVKAEIIGSFSLNQRQTPQMIHRLKYCYGSDKNGNFKTSLSGEYYVFEENIWRTAQDAYEEIKKRHEQDVKNFTEQIKTVSDLVLFPLQYPLFINPEAEKAYKEKAKELIHIDLDELITESLTES